MRKIFKRLVPFIIVLSMMLTTGAQSINLDNGDIEEGANVQGEEINLEKVEEVEELGDPSLKLEVYMEDKDYKNGDTIEYEIKLINDGEVDLEDIKVKENLNEDILIKELKVKEEENFKRNYKIEENNKLEEIGNKVEAEVKFDGQALDYKEEFKAKVVKEEPKEEETQEEHEEPEETEEEVQEAPKDKPEEKQEGEIEEDLGEVNEDEDLEEAKEVEEAEEEEEANEEKDEAEEYEFEKELEPNRDIGNDGPKIPLPSHLYQASSKMLPFSLTDTIAVNKTAKRSPGCRTFEVTLDITGTPQKAPVDVVLVIDRSGSMDFKVGGYYSNTRLYYAKQAAINFAGRVLGLNGTPGSRVSVVSFSGPTSTTGYGNQNQASTDLNLSTNLNTVTNTINGISAVGGTNTEAGFKQGQAVIQGATSNQNPNSNKVVVMLTDGLPTASNGNRYADTTAINHIHIQSAIAAGKNIYQNDIADVFTIGLTTGMNATEKALADNILTQAQNKGYYPAPSATDLDTIFNAISQSLGYAATNAKVVDKIGDNFNLVESSLPAGATYNSVTREITWNPGTIVEEAQLKYKVVAKPEFPGGLADTNKFAKLTYKDIFGTAGKTKDFPVPEVDVPTLIEISLTDATIISGDSISLGTGIDPLGENYMSPITGGDNDGETFTYEWRKVGDNTIISTDKNPSVSPTEDTEYEVTVTDSNGCIALATMTVKVTKKFDIGIKKIVNKDTHEELLDGAKFVLKKDGEVVKTEVTSSGYAWMNDLLPGTYTLQETEAPVGYKLNSQIYTITIAANGDITVDPNLAIETKDGKKVLVVENDLLEFNMRLKKVDKDGELLDGAEFELKKDGVVIPTSATVGGYIDLDNLLAGEYTLEETVAPTGYELNPQIYTIIIAANGDITIDPELQIVTEDSKKVIVVKNDLLEFDIGLKKVNKDGTLLDGAKFKWTKDGEETELDVVDGYIDINNLLAGTYTLEETKAPDGYKLNKTKYTVTISATGEVTVDPELVIETIDKKQVIVVENSEKGAFPSTGGPGTMIFIILGIGLMLISLVGYRNGGLKMKKNKKFLSLLMALVMVLAVASPVLATGTAGKTGSLTIHKLYYKDIMGNGIPGTGGEQTPPADTFPLTGAEFSIWKLADDAEMPGATPGGNADYVEVTAGADGLAVFNNLPYGRYYVEETASPKGVTQESTPFIVDIPTTSVDGTRLIDDVHVYPKNVLTLAKAQMTKVNEAGAGLKGAEFDLYKKINGEFVKINDGPLVTGENGKAPMVEDLEVGDYYFIETKAPEGYLKDTTKQEFTIASGDHDKLFEKTLVNSEKPGTPEKEADKDDAGIGDKVTWTIKTQLPGNIKTYTEYKITDDLDPALNYANNVVVKLGGVTLTEGTHYSLTEPATTGGGTLIINFTRVHLEGGELVITFDTIVNEKAKVGVDIENKAILDYNNGFEVGEEETPVVKVKVGGHKFKKVAGNKDGNGLEGAEFIVRRADGKYLVKGNDGMISWGTEAQATKFISDADGKFAVEGVAFGTYFLEETKAPAGYNKLQNPVEFEVSENTHTTELAIVNKTKPGMPQTGGMGTVLFTLIGLTLMGVAVKTYKKEEKEV